MDSAPLPDAPHARPEEPPLVVVADFNGTLVAERMLVRWSQDAMTHGPWSRRLRMALIAPPLGALCWLLDRLGGSTLAARLGFRILGGVREFELEIWARRRLTPREEAYAALEQLASEASFLLLVVVSRGSPGVVVRAFLGRDDVQDRLGRARVVVARDAWVPELEARAGELTGRLHARPTAKSRRASLVPDGAVFLGDRDDARWATRLTGRRFRFIQV